MHFDRWSKEKILCSIKMKLVSYKATTARGIREIASPIVSFKRLLVKMVIFDGQHRGSEIICSCIKSLTLRRSDLLHNIDYGHISNTCCDADKENTDHLSHSQEMILPIIDILFDSCILAKSISFIGTECLECFFR